MSLGEERVRLTFNPSDKSLVTELKQKSAAMIDLCEQSKWSLGDHADHEAIRLWSLAMTAYEEAAMWAVKAATA